MHDPLSVARRWSVTTLRDVADRLEVAPDEVVAELAVRMSVHVDTVSLVARRFWYGCPPLAFGASRSSWPRRRSGAEA